ncbi:MAG: CpXC domain-containing protein [Endomicrobiaceae bacterium]|nr:CpXC domain-containing protein [Endomicrobiaceae bacterium]
MSILSNCEITCHCGEVFGAELWTAVSISENPELKDTINSGMFNIVECPKCKHLFYWEIFFIYQDISSELIAYVYPKDYEGQATQYRKKMLHEFGEIVKSTKEAQNINFEPVLFFGIEDLVATLKNEDFLNDEIQIVNFIAKRIGLELIEIKPSKARNLCIPYLIPKIKKSLDCNIKDIIAGLEKLLSYNENLLEYEKLLIRIKNNPNCLDEILMHKTKK